jgi:flagellum-specific ATP synthase
VPGTNPQADLGTALMPRINAFLRQDLDDRSTAADAWAGLAALLREGAA